MSLKQEITSPNKYRWPKRILKWIIGILSFIVLLFLLVLILIQVPAVQKFAKDKTVNYLESTIKTPVRIDRLNIAFPKMIVLEGVYFEDQRGDTLLYGGSLSVNIDLFALIKNKVVLNELWLEDIQANIIKNEKGTFNFEYITKAFSSTDELKDTTANGGSTIQIIPGNLKFDDIYVRFYDQYEGSDMVFEIEQFRAQFGKVNMDSLDFNLKSLTWNGGAIKMASQAKSSYFQTDTVAIEAPPTPFTLTIDKANISSLEYSMINPLDGLNMKVQVGVLDSKKMAFSLTKQTIDFGTLDLSNSMFAMRNAEPLFDEIADSIVAKNWTINAGKINLSNSRLSMDDDTQTPVKVGMDYAHLNFSNINLKGENLYVVGGDTVRASIKSGSLFEKSGLRLTELSSEMLYTSQGITLDKLTLATPHTRITNFLQVGYESTDRIAEDPGHMRLMAVLNNVVIGHKDLLNVAPMLLEQPMFADFPNGKMRLNGKISGTIDDLNFDNVSGSVFGGTRIKINGNIKGLPDPEKLFTNLNVQELTLTGSDILKIVPPGTLPDNIAIPDVISLSGKVSGTIEGILQTNIAMTSSFGGATINGTITQATDPAKAVYNLKGSLKQFDLGKLMKQPETMGQISATFEAKGRSFDPATMSGQYKAYLSSGEILNHTYKNITLDATAESGYFTINSKSNEAELDYNISLTADMTKNYPAVNGELALANIDLQSLGFTDFPLNFQGNMQAIFPKLDIDRPEGSLLMTDLAGNYDTLSFVLDTMSVIATQTAAGQKLFASTSFMDASIAGDYTLTGIVPEMMQFLNRYYGFVAPNPSLAGDQQATITVKIKPSEEIFQFMAGLEMVGNLDMQLDFDSKLCIFDLKGDIPTISYAGLRVDGGSLFTIGNDTSIAYKIFLNEVGNEMFNVPTLLFQGDVSQNVIYTDVKFLDNRGRPQHTLAASIKHRIEGFALHFDPNSVLLDYDAWGLDPENELLIAPNGFYANSFTFSNGSQALILQTFGDSINDPIGIRLFNFEIATFTSIARQDSLYLNGTINGTAEVKLDGEHLEFLADMAVEDIRYKSDTLGNLSVKVNNATQDEFAIEAVFDGRDNLAEAYGTYKSSNGEFDISLDVEKLKFNTIQPFTMGYLDKMTGHLEGGISVTGTADKPMVIGNLLFRDADANVPMLNSVFSLRNERIRFLPDGVHFREFTLTDAEGKKAIIDGSMLTQTWQDFTFNIDFSADNFRVINSTRKDNNLFYGILYLDSKISFRGDLDRPVISASLKVNDKTDITMVIPQENPELADRDGIVEFIDPENPGGKDTYTLRLDSLAQSDIFGLTLNANIELVKEAIINIVIDENNGDMLSAQGTASLFGGIDPSGKMTMTGTYVIEEGSYETNLAMVASKEFSIQKGSTITWTGEPTTADIDVTALYKVRTAPYDLVESMIIGDNPQAQLQYKDRQPFTVELQMKGELLKPDIVFNIVLDNDANANLELLTTVNSRLEQLRLEQSEMNKQVFALILLNRFVAENPFSSSVGGGGVSAIARQSVSKLLADQLNSLAGDLIAGVELDFGINSEQDFSSGSGQMRTDLNVGISKRLLKDRLKVSVGSNFELEGPSRPNQKTSNIAGNVQADYLLSKDGRYILRAYRRDEYEVALQGQVIETGITFIITLDFNTFKEIFENRKARKIIRRREDNEEL